MKITITGATGFVGVNLHKYLESDLEISPISVRYTPNQELSLEGDVVIHLAGKAHDLKKVSDPSAYYEANFELTKQLFNAFLKSKASVFIFMSTVKAVADEVNGALTEDSIPNPKTHYGIAKQQAEAYMLSKDLPEAKRVYILRPCMIHGPGNKGNLNLLYQLVSKGLPWPLGDFKNERSFLSIENLCFVIKELLQRNDIASGIYNLADDEALSTNQIIQLLGQSLGKKSRILAIPVCFIRAVAKLGDILHFPLDTERLKKLTESYVVANTKISTVMGKNLPVKSKDGLLITFESFKNKQEY
ncbi:NAD-dependent epimerase/dehydratase family protein [Flavobacterium sp. I-SCBP12n]|uniref:NAD-dependent epimerase/dehydratase family protein n=1 Tax=Flavobacterium pygoscelis TaxID=2893176 RepID=A0A9X1XQB5_9FLAO|nr:NAD-dependent epimerase/dehydratase family protein [Flavobacterium pygoscelis]MCK8141454.1 NAD-dependent epimerase/dehydratase family protein [Flavobacterium pygoscelis]